MLNLGNIPKIKDGFDKFKETHPKITAFVSEQCDEVKVGDQIEISFIHGDSVQTKKLTLKESDIEFFKALKNLG